MTDVVVFNPVNYSTILGLKLEFFFSHNGEEALQALAMQPSIDLVLSDINMPVMDGLTLLGKLNESNDPRKAVIVSAYGDMPNIRTAMNRGAIDFLMKPIDFQDLEITIQKTLEQVGEKFGLTRERIRQIQEAALKKLRIALEKRDHLMMNQNTALAA